MTTPSFQPAPAPQPEKRGLAIAALVVGIIAFLSALAPVWGLLVGLVAIILGVLALRARQHKVMSTVGIVGGGIAAVVSLVVTIIAVASIGAVSQGVQEAVASAEATAPVGQPAQSDSGQQGQPDQQQSTVVYEVESDGAQAT